MEQKGDLIIWDLWQQGIDSVHDMRVVNTYAPTYQFRLTCVEGDPGSW